MLVRTRNISDYFAKIDHALDVADKKKSFDSGMLIANEIIGLLGIEQVSADLKSFPRLKSNPSWTKNAPDYEDRKASYVLAENNDRGFDFKLFWVNKPTKRIISNLVTLTPNFEDETFYANKSIGIDFVLSENADHLIVVLSNYYKIRVLEVHNRLSNTQKKIFEKWTQDFDFGNRAQIHQILWDSFDIQPLNKEFYIEISGLFNDLVQHLEKKKILDKKHRPQFVNRLIGRIIFCWFLKKKEIINSEMAYFDADGLKSDEYYNLKLEKLFFKVLNTPIDERDASDNDLQKKMFPELSAKNLFNFNVDFKTPFLNGGLFEEKESDLAGRGELSFPVDYFERFYTFLNRYNFTTDESTSDFQQVAIDPEMLGRIFENLLAEETEVSGEQARKAKGAFYTPREIVDYMCRESLRAYLTEKLGDDGRKEEVLQILFDKKEHELDSNILVKLGTYKSKIVEALDEIKIIDLACGSGAFPIGMLQIILSIYERVDTRLDHYKTKLGVIKNNIFGVDIEPMAVEISRLRAWLSLIVDSTIKTAEKNKGIEELPNLDFKFVCANSLLQLEHEEGLFDNKDIVQEMRSIRERYFRTSSLRIKEKMKNDFQDILKKNQSIFASKKQQQLLSYHPFDTDNISQFFDSRFMFDVDGFNIVIGNPPWGQKSVKFSDAEKVLFKKLYPSATVGIMDISRLFIERAISILSPGGSFANVLPDIILLKNYDTTRKFILDNLIINKLDYWGMAFENVNLDSCTLIGEKDDKINRKNNIITCTVHSNKEVVVNKIPQKLFLEAEGYKFNLYYSNKICDLLDKLKTEKKVGDFFDPHEGIHSGNIREKLFVDKKLNNNCKKLIFGRGEVAKYCVTWEGKWVNYDRSIIDKGKGEYAGLGKPEYFERPKLIVRRTGDFILAGLDDNGYYFSNNVFVCVPKEDLGEEIKYFLGLLNSKLATWFYRTIQPRKGKLFAELKINVLKQIPIKDTSTNNKKAVIELVNKILMMKKKDSRANTSDSENKLDQLVYDIFELTEDQKALIEKS